MGENISTRHQALIEQLKRMGLIRTPVVEAAFRAVPRHLFLPDVPVEKVYQDEAIVTKRLDGQPVSSSSQPAVMAIMLEQLDLKPGHRVLEIGAGTGYNAALIAHIVGDTGQVITVDLDEDIAENARNHLATADFDQKGNREQGIGNSEGTSSSLFLPKFPLHPGTSPHFYKWLVSGGV